MSGSKRRTLFAALAALVFPALVGSGNLDAAGLTPAALKAKGSIVVGTSTGAFPFEMTDKTGKLIGFDMDIANAIAKDLGIKTEVQNYSFSGLIPAMISSKVDVVIAEMTRTDKRKEVIDFSDPYYLSGQVLLVSRTVPNVKKWQDLDKPGYTVAVSLGTTADLIASQIFKKATVKRYDGNAMARMEVLNGKAQCLVNESAPVFIFQYEHPKETYAIMEPFTTEDICIGVPKGNPALVEYLNGFLKKYKTTAEFKKSYHYWFETMDWYAMVPPKK